jgi:hypothetical protein
MNADVQMSVTLPSGMYVSSVKSFKVIRADREGRLSIWVTPGWYRRLTSPEGVISLIPMRRWRLRRHRLLWGFSGLVDGR